MTITAPAARRAVSPRGGYAIAALAYTAVLIGINSDPGIRALPFISDSIDRALPFVNVSLVVAIAVNMCYLFRDTWWFTAIGDLLFSLGGLAATLALWIVFPFGFSGTAWTWLAHLVLGLAAIANTAGAGMELAQLLVPSIRRISQQQ